MSHLGWFLAAVAEGVGSGLVLEIGAGRSTAADAEAEATTGICRLTTIYVDADACPVKSEAESVATRLGIPMVLVCNGGVRPSNNPLVSLRIVSEGPDAADRWIADNCGPGDVVVTGDIPLADRCLKAGSHVLQHDGQILNLDNIGERLAMRDLMKDIRAANPFHQGGGPEFTRAHRSRFLQALDTLARLALR